MLEIFNKVGSITKATNGQEAFEYVRDNELASNGDRAYDMIFMDLDMPIKNGYEACVMIRKHYETINGEQKVN